MQENRTAHTTRDFFQSRKGKLVLVSADQESARAVKDALKQELGPIGHLLIHVSRTEAAMEELALCQQNGEPVIIVVERIIQGRPTSNFISHVRANFPDARILVLTGETFPEILSYLKEIGADNILTKPVCETGIIEKLAYTLRPPGRMHQLMDKARECLEAKDFSSALELTEEILRVKPGSPAGLMLRGDVFLALGKNTRARDNYLKAHEQSVTFLEPLKKLAAFHKNGDMSKYLEYLQKLDRLSPLNKERKCEIGHIHAIMGDQKTAERYFDQAMQCAVTEAMELVSNMALDIADRVQDSAPAISEKFLRQALDNRNSPFGASAPRRGGPGVQDMTIFNRLGIVLRRRGKWEEAVKHYHKALTIAPRDEVLFYNMGMAFLDGRKFSDAARCFSRAVEINPDFHSGNQSICFNLGVAYYSLNRYGDAEQYLNQVLDRDPGHERAQKMLRAICKDANAGFKQSATLRPSPG